MGTYAVTPEYLNWNPISIKRQKAKRRAKTISKLGQAIVKMVGWVKAKNLKLKVQSYSVKLKSKKAKDEQKEEQKMSYKSYKTFSKVFPVNYGKETSKLAIASILCVPLALVSFLLVMLPGPLGGIGAIGGGLFLVGGLVLGLIAVVVITFHKNELKGYLYTILPIFLGAVFVWFFIEIWIYAGNRAHYGRCRSNLEKLSYTITRYAEANNGRLPTADGWCDSLMEFDPTLSKDIFNCPAGKKYIYNKAVDSLLLKNVPQDVVLLFEGNGGWNFTGRNRLACYVLLADGTVQFVKPVELGALKWKDEQKE